MAEAEINHGVVLASYPKGIPTQSNFKFVEVPSPPITVSGDQPEDTQQPLALDDDEIVVAPHYYCVDPFLRLMIAGDQTPFAVSPKQAIAIGEPIYSGCVGEVLASRCSKFASGDIVKGLMPWQKFVVLNNKKTHIDKVSPLPEGLPYSVALSALGRAGLTAYFGLLEYGKPQKGDTVVISSANGAVGLTAGQIAKIYGCKVIGVVPPGGNVLRSVMIDELGFDDVVEEVGSCGDMKSALLEACPNGIDIYFDDAGGVASDAVTLLLNTGARYVLVGQGSLYNASSFRDIQGPRLDYYLALNGVCKTGFHHEDFKERSKEAKQKLMAWIKEGKLVPKYTEVEGFENLPSVFTDLAARTPILGKAIVKV